MLGVVTIKEVVSVSIGSSARDHEVEIDLLGERFRIRREGTDGDLAKAAARFAELDGTVAALGMGGIDLFLRADGRTYYFRDAKQLTRGVTHTPVVDGSGLKGPIEGSTIDYLTERVRPGARRQEGAHDVGRRPVGHGRGAAGGGDAAGLRRSAYAVDVPIIVKKWGTLVTLIHVLTPLVVQLPFSLLYPTGGEQDKQPKRNPSMERLYDWADVIAGDWLYVRKFMPDDMRGKWIITNTTTAATSSSRAARGVELLVTSTPRLDGRSFGTNVIEATMVALDGAPASCRPSAIASCWTRSDLCRTSLGCSAIPRQARECCDSEGSRHLFCCSSDPIGQRVSRACQWRFGSYGASIRLFRQAVGKAVRLCARCRTPPSLRRCLRPPRR